MIVLIPYINFLNLSWIIKCLFLRNMEPLRMWFWVASIKMWFWKKKTKKKKKKKLRSKINENSTSKNWSAACPFVAWQCSSPQILNCSTVCEVWKGQCIVASSQQTRPGPCDFFLFPKKTTTKKCLSGSRYRSQSALGSAFHQFLMGVPKGEYESKKNGLKDWNTVFWLKGNISKVTIDKKVINV